MNTSSNPICDLAKEYGVPLEVAYCYAEYIRQTYLAKTKDEWTRAENEYWAIKSIKDLIELSIPSGFNYSVNTHIKSFLTLQGRLRE